MEAEKGRLLLSNSHIPEMRLRSKQWSRRYIFFGALLLILVIVADAIILLIVELVSWLWIIAIVLQSAIIIPLSLSLLFAAYGSSFVDVYENGLTLPERSIVQILRGKKENFVPFSQIKAIITNSETEYPNVALELANKELLIDKRDIYDLKEFEDVIMSKVKYVWTTSPDEEIIKKVLGKRKPGR